MSDDILKSIQYKVDKIADDIVDIKVTQGMQQVSLDEHIKRSDMLEELYRDIKEKELEPVKKEIYQIKGIYKFIGILGVLASITTIILKLLKII